MRTPKALLAHDTGLGKTVEAIAYICELFDSSQLSRLDGSCVWLTEANLIEQTAEAFRSFAPGLVVTTSKEKGFRSRDAAKWRLAYADKYFDGFDVVIVSYDSFHALGKGDDQSFADRYPHPSIVVLDEVMALKGGGDRARSVARYTRRADRIVAMTATPFENHPYETYEILSLLHLPDLWPRPEFDLCFIEWSEPFGVGRMFVPAAPICLRPEAVEHFKELLHRYMHRRTAEDANLRLPVKVGETLRWVLLDQSQQHKYDRLTQIKGGAGHILRTQAGREANGSSTLVDTFIEALRSEFVGEKVIVYCESLSVLGVLADRLTQGSVGHRVIEGKVKTADRTTAMADFRDDPAVRVLVGSKVLELGLNLQFCRVLISLDCSDNPQREHQREGRIRRIGSPHATYQHLTLIPYTPVTQKKIADLRRKANTAQELLSTNDVAG